MARIVTRKAITDDYDDLAPVYDRHWATFNRTVRDWVMARVMADLPQGAAVLDAGCGTGHVLAALAAARTDLNLTGVDTSTGMLAQAQDKAPGTTLVAGDIAHHNFGQAQYDAVLALNVLHHMNAPEEFLQRMVAACKPGGVVFLCDFAVESLSMKLAERYWRRFKPSHHKAFTVAEMATMLAALPVTVVDRDVLRPDIFWRLQIYRLRKA